MKTILSLFDYTGSWSRPYFENGYNVIRIDIRLGIDILNFDYTCLPSVYGILAAPPCTHFSLSGVRYWRAKDKDGRTDEHLKLIDRTLEIINFFNPHFWVIENPVGRLKKLRLGQVDMYFQPYEYGDPYTKKTCLWGRFNQPIKNPVEPIKRIAPGHHSIDNYNKYYLNKKLGKNRVLLRQTTPPGFALAFFKANP